MSGDLSVVTVGRISADIYPEQVGVSLPDVTTFRKSLGGTATNVAVAATRMGDRATVVTKVGDDPFGVYCRRALEGFGVDTRFVGTDPDLHTPLAFCEIHPPDHFPLFFYREPSAPDLQIRTEELDLATISTVPLLWTTGTALSAEPSRSTVLDLIEARGGRLGAADNARFTVHDLDWRPMLWKDPSEAPAWAKRAVLGSNVVVGNREEVALVVGDLPAQDAARALLDLGVEVAIVKQGPGGVVGARADELIVVPPVPVDVVNGLGAGDAFGGALCHGLLAGWSLDRILRTANAAGAYVAARLTCADVMPTLEDLRPLLGMENQQHV